MSQVVVVSFIVPLLTPVLLKIQSLHFIVRELQCPTIRYIHHKARPVFARVLSDVLKSICYENSEEAWLRLFMLPKCVLRASRRGGRNCKHPSIEQLCNLWSQSYIGIIWSRINKCPVIAPQKQNSQVDIYFIGLSREGLLGKACQALVSPGVAPNTLEVWDLLRQKHPKGLHPSLPISSSPHVNHVLPHDFNTSSVLHSFPKVQSAALQGFIFIICLMLLRSIYLLLFAPLCVV